MKLEDLQVYILSMATAEEVWNIVQDWDYFARETIGKQFVKSSDSIASNLSEGYGRYFYKENKQFCYYSRGSLLETKTWLRKTFNRKLIDERIYLRLLTRLDTIGVKLNNYIKSIGNIPDKDDSK